MTGNRLPFEFVLEAIEPRSPYTKAMFGCHAVYVGEQIVLFLRDRSQDPEQNGVWLATTPEHHASLSAEFASLRPIGIAGPDSAGWLLLPSSHPKFEEDALRACELILEGDARVGHVPKSKGPKAAASRARKAR